jgi:hypothetical protein
VTFLGLELHQRYITVSVPDAAGVIVGELVCQARSNTQGAGRIEPGFSMRGSSWPSHPRSPRTCRRTAASCWRVRSRTQMH